MSETTTSATSYPGVITTNPGEVGMPNIPPIERQRYVRQNAKGLGFLSPDGTFYQFGPAAYYHSDCTDDMSEAFPDLPFGERNLMEAGWVKFTHYGDGPMHPGGVVWEREPTKKQIEFVMGWYKAHGGEDKMNVRLLEGKRTSYSWNDD